MRLPAIDRAATTLLLALAACSDPVTPPPVEVPSLADVSLGQTHTCALMSDGVMSCWGFNMSGQLGRGVPASNSYLPVAVPMDRPFADVAAGSSHTCGLDEAGAPFCWGYVSGGRDPVAPGGSMRFRKLSAGAGSTCGLDAEGAAYCWGAAGATPVRVAPGMTFVAIEIGSAATCGLATAGAAYCWGSNAVGTLGDGTTTPSATPVAVTGGHVFTEIDLGAFHACGLKADGSVWCWGDATHGQMGDGRPPSFASPSTPVGQPTPVRVASTVPFIGISAGERFNCALALTGTWCWGYNSGGQLGDGTTMHRGSPVEVGGGRTFASIHAGGYHTCAIGMDGMESALYCWGDNSLGQLGVGAGKVHRTPVRVTVAGDG